MTAINVAQCINHDDTTAKCVHELLSYHDDSPKD
jgi:hypothetical protein